MFINGDNCTQYVILFIVAVDVLVTIVVDDFCIIILIIKLITLNLHLVTVFHSRC